MAQLGGRLFSLCRMHRRCCQRLLTPQALPAQFGFIHTSDTRSSTRHRRTKRAKAAEPVIETEQPTKKPTTSLIVDMLAGDIVVGAEFQKDHQLAVFDEKIQELDMLLSAESEVDLPDVILSGNMAGDDDLLDDDDDDDDNNNDDVLDLELDSNEDGSDDVHYLEELVLDQPHIKLSLPRDHNKKVSLYGNPDPSEPISEVPCPGCGALLHCQDPLMPGYLPTQKYKNIPQEELRNNFCQRCHMMRNFNQALGVTVHPSDYVRIISGMRDVHALAILIVDITDIEGSLIRNLPALIGRRRPVIILGNKIDLLPQDDGKYLRHVRDVLETVCRSAGIYDDLYVHLTALVSARTGYGVEDLITKLFKYWTRKGHVYLLGCTNVGKSSLFNALLSSDYCKATSRDYIHRATTSVWPGTTLNLLKFPIMAPDLPTLRKRLKRLKTEGRRNNEEMKLEEKRLNPTRVLSLKERVGQTIPGAKASILEEHHKTIHGYMGSTYTFNQTTDRVEESKFVQSTLKHEVFGDPDIFDESIYEQSKWCHDTPGLVNPDQMINVLNQKELSLVLPKYAITPRNYVIRPGMVMFLSGLGRIEYYQGTDIIYLTVFACKKLPVHFVPMDTAHDFYRKNIGTDTFVVPSGDEDHLNRIPSLVGREFIVRGQGWKEGSADIVLSSLGWVTITTGYRNTGHIRAYTPGGRGCYLRTPPLLKYCVLQKGDRVRGTPQYKQKATRSN